MTIRHHLAAYIAIGAALVLFSTAVAAAQDRSIPRRAPVTELSRPTTAEDSQATTPGDTPAVRVPAQPADIRIAWFDGDVNVIDANGSHPVAIGAPLDSSSVLKLGRRSRVQISVNGAVESFNKQGRLPVAKALQATRGRANADVAAALEYLSQYSHLTLGGAVDPEVIQSAVASLLGIDVLARNVREDRAVESPVILEPRATAVTRGPLRFRWTGNGDSVLYEVTVYDSRGTIVFAGETTDTTLIWDGAVLFVEQTYTWSLARAADTTIRRHAHFRRLDDIKGMRVEGGESRIRTELGSENPALPLLLGAHFATNGLHGDAGRLFTAAALKTDEHYRRFMRLAREQFSINVGLSEPELEKAFPVVAARAR